jgi:hypothetical protein
MFSNIKGVYRLWPDKDRVIYCDEFLRKRGPNFQLGIDNPRSRAFVQNRFKSSDATFFYLLKRISLLQGLTILFAGNGLAASASVTLAWNAVTDSTVIGYNLFYGTSSASLTQKLNVGKVTTTTVSALTVGTTYYFAVTAYNAAGVNSARSNEISFQPGATSTPTPTPTPSSATPVAKSDSGFVAVENTAFPIAASALLANDTDPYSYSLSITSVGNAVNGTVSYNTSTKIVTFVPKAGYTGAASFTYTISNGHGGTALASVTLVVNLPTASLFSVTESPVTAAFNDSRPLVLGLKFQTSAAGAIKGIRFYKSPLSTGTHVGNLWSTAGTLLATATFTNETASGWQQVNLPSPVTLTPGTTYIVSYNTNNYYCADLQYFSKALTSGPLTAPASSASGGNGIYIYASASTFPKNSYSSCNYWVDVAFAPTMK